MASVVDSIGVFIMLPLRACLGTISVAWSTALSILNAIRWLTVDWGWTEPLQSAVTGTAATVALPTLKFILFMVLATVSWVASASIYLGFYQYYVPQISHQYPAYFDFGCPA